MASGFEGFGRELLEKIRADARERLEEAAWEERVNCLYKTTKALKEIGVDHEEIIRLLQKYWDLRRSEAISLIKVQIPLKQHADSDRTACCSASCGTE